MLQAASVCLLLWLTTSGASAEKAILFAPAGHSDLAASLGPAALEALEAGLRDAGWQTLSPSQAGERLDRLGAARCTSGLCVPEMLTALEADTAIGLAVWARHGESTPYEIALTFMARIPPAVNATALVEAGDVRGATRAALAQALTRWSRRHAVTLRVTGQPAGAAITLDGRPAGRLPYEAHVAEGSHDVSVSQNGYVTERRDVEIPEEGEAVALEVALATDPGSGAERTSPGAVASQEDHRARTRPLVGPLLLAAGGVVGVAWGSYSLAQVGCTQHDTAGICTNENRLDTAPVTIALIGGGLALVGAVLWFSLGGKSAAHPHHAQLGLGPEGARLSLQF